MQEKVRHYIEENHMIDPKDIVLAAVSGGADSMCLLLMLRELCGELGFTLCVVHVEHGIRGEESLADARFVEDVCKGLKIPCKVRHCLALQYARQEKLSVEEAARKLRYQIFWETAGEFGANKVAVAHNQNDRAETMLFHLARGSGLSGLCGIRPVRGQVIRPLLCVTRGEIEQYLAKKGQGFCIDSTNEELLYTRNKIRRQIIPLLTQINANAVSHMNQAAGLAEEAAELIEELSQQAAERHIWSKGEAIFISCGLLKEPSIVIKAALHRALAKKAGSSKDLASIHVQQLWQLFARQNGKQVKLPYGLLARRDYEGILLENSSSKEDKAGERQTGQWELLPGGSLHISSYACNIHTRILEKTPHFEEIPKKMYTKWFDYDKIKGTTRLRTRREHDYLTINKEGKRKTLKKYFIDEKIAAGRRDHILLLADDTHILWVVGYRISEDVKVTEHTKRILEVRVDGGEEIE